MHYRKQRRGGKGVRDIRTSERNGPVVGVLLGARRRRHHAHHHRQGMVNRTHVSEIRIVGRNTQGVRIMNLNEGDKIAPSPRWPARRMRHRLKQRQRKILRSMDRRRHERLRRVL